MAPKKRSSSAASKKGSASRGKKSASAVASARGRAAQAAWTDFRRFLAERRALPLADRLGREMERIGGSI